MIRTLLLLSLLLIISCSSEPEITQWNSALKDVTTDAVEQVDIDDMMNFLDTLCLEPRNVTTAPDHSSMVFEMMKSRFESYGYEIASDAVSIDTFQMSNLWAIKRGRDSLKPAVILNAHWDSVENAPGGNDNGSSMVLLFEIARILQNISLERDLIFLLPAFEEYGMIGSYQFVKKLDRDIEVMINCDPVGATSSTHKPIPFFNLPEEGNFISLIAPEWCIGTAYEAAQSADIFVPELPYVIIEPADNYMSAPMLVNVVRSDHLPFWEKNIPALNITDMANFRNDHYHTPDDTPENVDPLFLSMVTKMVLSTIILRAGE